MSCVDNRGENIPGRGNSKHRDYAEGVYMACSRNSQEASVAATVREGEAMGDTDKKERRKEYQGGSAGPGEGFGFFLRETEKASSKTGLWSWNSKAKYF